MKEEIADAAILYFLTQKELRSIPYGTDRYTQTETDLHKAWDRLRLLTQEFID